MKIAVLMVLGAGVWSCRGQTEVSVSRDAGTRDNARPEVKDPPDAGGDGQVATAGSSAAAHAGAGQSGTSSETAGDTSDEGGAGDGASGESGTAGMGAGMAGRGGSGMAGMGDVGGAPPEEDVAGSAGETGGGGGAASGASGMSNMAGMNQVPPQGDPPPAVINDCGDLGAVEVLEDITPPSLRADNAAFAVATDPVNHGVVYVGSIYSGLWKSDNCGADFYEVATGRNADSINTAMTWSLAVDPVEPETVYAVAGYTSVGPHGLYKSTNGGVDWDISWPPAHQPELVGVVDYEFGNVVTVDPEDRHHLVLTFHAFCRLPPNPDRDSICFAESFNGGDDWHLIPGLDEWSDWEGQSLFFIDRTTWLWSSQLTGSHVLDFANSGDEVFTATRVPNLASSHIQGSGFLKSHTGRYFVAGGDGLWVSPDGRPETWRLINGTGPIAGGIVEVNDNLYSSNCYFADFCAQPEYFKSTNDGETWTKLNPPNGMTMGGAFAVDYGHNLVFSSGGSHVLRFRVE